MTVKTIPSERGKVLHRMLDRYVGIPLCFMLGLRKKRTFSVSDVPASIGILVFGAIGDALLASVIIDSLRRKYPSSNIILFVSESNKVVLQLLDKYDEGIVVPVFKPALAISRIRNRNLDLLVDTSQWPRISAIITRFSRPRFSVGFKTRGQARHWVYDLAVEHANDRHEILNFHALARSVGGDATILPAIKPVAEFTAEDFGVKQRFVVFHPWAAGFKSYLREWPQEYWVALAEKLYLEKISIFISGSAADAKRADELIRACDPKLNVTSLCGKISLPSLGACLLESAAVVSVNTGIMHFSATLGAKTISLNGPTNARRWGAYGKLVRNINVEMLPGAGILNLGFEYPKEVVYVMPNISVDDVFREIMSLSSM